MCAKLASVVIGNSVTSIGDYAFDGCGNLKNIVVPDSVTTIGTLAFDNCGSLTSVTIGNGITDIGTSAFNLCPSLTALYFTGNCPIAGTSIFSTANVTVYYLPGTTGWGPTFGGCPTSLWNPQFQTSDASFGVQTNRFGFNITGTTNIPNVQEACTNLAGPVWTTLQSCTLTNGLVYFGDPDWTNYPARFYRIRSP